MEERARGGRPVRVALVGAGRFGTTVVAGLSQTPSLRLSVVCDLRAESARGAWEAFSGKAAADRAITTDNIADVATAVDEGRPVTTSNLEAAVSAPIDVVVEATGLPEIATRTALGAIRNGHHVVMVTVEADVLVGSVLRRYA